MSSSSTTGFDWVHSLHCESSGIKHNRRSTTCQITEMWTIRREGGGRFKHTSGAGLQRCDPKRNTAVTFIDVCGCVSNLLYRQTHDWSQAIWVLHLGKRSLTLVRRLNQKQAHRLCKYVFISVTIINACRNHCSKSSKTQKNQPINQLIRLEKQTVVINEQKPKPS